LANQFGSMTGTLLPAEQSQTKSLPPNENSRSTRKSGAQEPRFARAGIGNSQSDVVNLRFGKEGITCHYGSKHMVMQRYA
jgi:hypothetical protein